MASINSKKHFILAAVTFVIAACSFVSCNRHNTDTKLQVDTSKLRSGDLIFREGPSFNSKVVKTMSDSRFSHVGIVYKSAHGWKVVHAVPDESESHATDYVKCEPIDFFLEPSKAKSAKFMRIKCSSRQALNAACYAISKARNKTLFDNDYDLQDTSKLYCTELVWQAYKHQGINLVSHTHSIKFIGKTKEVIFPVDFLRSALTDSTWKCR